MGAAGGDDGPSSSSSITVSVVTLLKNMIGGGIFSLPIGLWYGTPYIGIGILAFTGALSALTYWMVGYCCLAWEVGSFRDLWNNTLGKRTSWMIDLILFVNSWFTAVTYLVLIGDLTTKSFAGLLGEEHILARSRNVNQWTITVVLLLPLSLKQDLRQLAFTSALGLGVLLYVIILVVGDFLMNAPAKWGAEVVLSEWRIGSFEAIAIYTHAFVAHYNAPKLFAELDKPTHGRWFQVVAIAYSIALVTYAVFAWTGFRLFEGSIKGNILRNYDPQFKVFVAWLGMGFSISFTYPIVFNAMRSSVVGLLNRVLHRTGRIVTNLGSQTTVVLVLLTAISATLCDEVGIINALSGSIFGCLISFIIPSLLFFCTAWQQLQSITRSTLTKPLLSKKGPRGGSSQNMLRIALFGSVICGVLGIAFAIIGTCVILARASLQH